MKSKKSKKSKKRTSERRSTRAVSSKRNLQRAVVASIPVYTASPESRRSQRDPICAVAAALPADALQWCKQQALEDCVREEHLEIVSGKDGFTAMLSFEHGDIGESTALELAAKYDAVTYFLDFDEYAELTRQFQVKVQRQEGDPVAFLKSHGIIPPSRRPQDLDEDDIDDRKVMRELANALDPKHARPWDPIQLTEDPQWAIATAFPTEDYPWYQRRLPWPLSAAGSQVITGKKGFWALMGYGGAHDLWMSVAVSFSELLKSSMYLLKLGGDERWTQRLRVRVEDQKESPAEFLAAHGVEGFEPTPALVSTACSIGVVDDITLEQAQKALPKAKEKFSVNARGVLVNESGYETIQLTRTLKRQSFDLTYYPSDGTFVCVVQRPGQEAECFDPKGEARLYKLTDSILGETTLEGILRVLDIPRHMLPLPPEDAATEKSQAPKRR